MHCTTLMGKTFMYVRLGLCSVYFLNSLENRGALCPSPQKAIYWGRKSKLSLLNVKFNNVITVCYVNSTELHKCNNYIVECRKYDSQTSFIISFVSYQLLVKETGNRFMSDKTYAMKAKLKIFLYKKSISESSVSYSQSTWIEQKETFSFAKYNQRSKYNLLQNIRITKKNGKLLIIRKYPISFVIKIETSMIFS